MFSQRRFLLLAMALAVSCSKSDVAPVPVITGFSPTTGPTQSSVLITGHNFSSTPNQNEVRFNGALGNVTTSTNTSITVKVPDNATTGIISVTISGQSGLSTDPFTINPLIGAWLSTGVTANNCINDTENGVYPCTTDCPTLTFGPKDIIWNLNGSIFNFTYTLTGTRLDISNGLSVFSPTYVISGSHLTLVYPPADCVLTETYVRN